MTPTGIITAIVIGLVLGVLGRMVVPGAQKIPIWLTILVGIAAAFGGTWLAQQLGISTETDGIDWMEVLVQVGVAAVGILLVTSLMGKRGARR